MLIQAYKPGIDRSWAPSFAVPYLHLQPSAKSGASLDDVPVMPATVLGLELLLQEPVLDLRMASELVLSDVGATIQIFRLIGVQYELAEDRPIRIEDCIASLDVDDWFHAVSAATFAGVHPAATTAWKHARIIAQCAQLIAGSLEGVRPEEAYLVGLLHEIETIPAILNWQMGGANAAEIVTMLTREWSLPSFVSDARPAVKGSRTSWKSILSAAHALAGGNPEFANSEFANTKSQSSTFDNRGGVLKVSYCEAGVAFTQ